MKNYKLLFNLNKNLAFQRLYEDFYYTLLAISISITNSEEASQDVIQMLFFKIADKKLYKHIENWEHYLARATRKMSINYVREEQKRRFHTNNCQVEQMTEIEIDMDLVYEIIAQLPKKQRYCYEKIILENWTYESVARDQNVSINTVKTNLRQAKRYVREKVS